MKEYEIPEKFPPMPPAAVGGVWNLEAGKFDEFFYDGEIMQSAADDIDRSGLPMITIDSFGKIVENSGY
jgi:hypothetical protein